MKKNDDRIEFRLLGGSRQMMIKTGADVRRIADLDPVHWTMTGTQTDSMIGDSEFLKLLDSDGNGRIRCDEVKGALEWMLLHLKDLSGVEQKSDYLALDSLRGDTPEGTMMANTVRVVLRNMNLTDSKGVTLAQISDHAKIVAAALQNGDGVIPPDPVDDPETADCIRSVMALIGSHKDLSGADGINGDDLTAFETQAAQHLAWIDEYEADPGRKLPFGEATAELYRAYCAIREKTDDFFRSVAALRFGVPAPAAATTCDPLDQESVKAYLEKTPICNPRTTDRLERGSSTVNPLWAEKVDAFFDAYSKAAGHAVDSADACFWEETGKKLAPYADWFGRKKTAIFDSFDIAKLRSYAAGNIYGKIRGYITVDLAVSGDLLHCKAVRKLILFQKNILTFLNNFVSLRDLFDTSSPSMIQLGKLVMDGRIFSLCTLVPNPAEHKKIVEKSDICVMYLDVSRGVGADFKTMKLAVAVTSGHVRNIFIGKSGVFFTDDGQVWDAKIFDFVKQPVSISEAVREPFYKFAGFLQSQADKYFSTRSKSYEDNIAKNIQSQALPAGAAKPQTPAVSGAMVMMGGGIGIAAIGSAFAFMAKSLQGISVGVVLAVFLGILFIFGGPVIAVSLVKLFNRNLSRFFEANGYAINTQMRLSLKMGRVFTFTPKMPFTTRTIVEKIISGDSEERSKSIRARIFWWLVLLLVLLVCAWFFRGRLFAAVNWCRNFFSSL